MTALSTSTPETVTSKPDQELEEASPRELASRKVARLIKENIVTESKWGRDSVQAVAARAKSDEELLKVDYGVASEGVARGNDLKPNNLDEAAAAAANSATEQQRLQRGDLTPDERERAQVIVDAHNGQRATH
jgi:hypothetical protein